MGSNDDMEECNNDDEVLETDLTNVNRQNVPSLDDEEENGDPGDKVSLFLIYFINLFPHNSVEFSHPMMFLTGPSSYYIIGDGIQ
jgi:hypothetical protein